MTESIVLGVDLGGTKIEAVVLRLRHDGAFEELDRERTETLAHEGYQRVLEQCRSVIERVEARHTKTALRVGVAMPGGVRRSDGTVKNSNATCLNGRPFRQDLCRQLQRSIAFDNDANCFALAEALLGAGRPFRDGVVFGVIMGTGVGGGLVVHGRLWSGLHGIAGEWGHHPVHDGVDRLTSRAATATQGTTPCTTASTRSSATAVIEAVSSATRAARRSRPTIDRSRDAANHRAK